MTKLEKAIFVAAAIIAAAANANAGDNTFKATFSYDATQSAEVNYAAFKNTATRACQNEATRAGFRAAESTAGQKRKCVKQLVARAVKKTRNERLVAVHMDSTNARMKTRKFAAK